MWLSIRIFVLFLQDVVARLPEKWRTQLLLDDQLWAALKLFTPTGTVVSNPHMWYSTSAYKPSGLSVPRETQSSETSKEYRHILLTLQQQLEQISHIIWFSFDLTLWYLFHYWSTCISNWKDLLIPMPPLLLGWSVLSTQTSCMDVKEDVETTSWVRRLLDFTIHQKGLPYTSEGGRCRWPLLHGYWVSG